MKTMACVFMYFLCLFYFFQEWETEKKQREGQAYPTKSPCCTPLPRIIATHMLCVLKRSLDMHLEPSQVYQPASRSTVSFCTIWPTVPPGYIHALKRTSVSLHDSAHWFSELSGPIGIWRALWQDTGLEGVFFKLMSGTSCDRAISSVDSSTLLWFSKERKWEWATEN